MGRLQGSHFGHHRILNANLAITVTCISIVVMSFLKVPCAAQPGDSTAMGDVMITPSAEKLEDTVVTDMLRIVDRKFDTLTTRLTALERAVSNLQFYSIRQFRVMDGYLQSVKTEVESVGKEVTQLEVDTRGMKITTNLVHREVTELKTMTTDVLNELDSSVVYINSNIDKQTQYIKTMIQDSFLKTSQDSTKQIQKSIIAAFGRQSQRDAQDEKVNSRNCTVDFSSVLNHVDARFANLKNDVDIHFKDLVDTKMSEAVAECEAARKRDVEQREVQTRMSKQETNVKHGADKRDYSKHTGGSLKAFPGGKRAKEINKQSTTAHVSPRGGLGHLQPQTVKETKNISQPSTSSDLSLQHEQDALVMEALSNMTTSVQQAVSYFRNTAHLLELVVSNTDMLVHAQLSPTASSSYSIADAMGKVAQEPKIVSDGPIGKETRLEQSKDPLKEEIPRKISSSGRATVDGCGLSAELVGSLATMMRNGSQLLELLTDLAQMSSVSLVQATNSLQEEVVRVEGVRLRMANTILNTEKAAAVRDDEREEIFLDLGTVGNTTIKTQKLVEAIASNSGWLPPIFYKLQTQESVINRTLQFVSRSHGILLQLAKSDRDQQESERKEKEEEEKKEDNISNRITNGPGDIVVGARGPETSSDEFTLDEKSMETIYSTSLQLHRIMPALTKLLAEPDPLFTLVGGGRPDQGRVEIYHLGQWGALCHQDLNHTEADIICRHLGFKGGISAGAGHFGAGGGVTWKFNASCLASAACPSVSHATSLAACSHEKDAAVICDHMLRIVPSKSSKDGKFGRLEIYHRGLWLPICGHSWGGYSARVACRQLGYRDGREISQVKWPTESRNITWLAGVACEGGETRLDACPAKGWTDHCSGGRPAGLRCV